MGQRTRFSTIINIAGYFKDNQLDFEDLQSSKHYNAYYASFLQTKLCLLLFSLELSKRIKDTRISVIATSPGTFKSNLVREAPWYLNLVMKLISGNVEAAARNILWIASSDEVVGISGKLFVKRKEKILTPYMNDANIRAHLWSVTESMLNDKG